MVVHGSSRSRGAAFVSMGGLLQVVMMLLLLLLLLLLWHWKTVG